MQWLTFILSILGAIAFVFTLILKYEEVRKKIKGLMNQLRKGFGHRRQMPREWRWWKRYRPSCEIYKVGVLRITQSSEKHYYMELKIEVKYTSRDNRHDTSMDITSVDLDVYNIGKGRDSKPYRLSRSDFPLKVDPIEEDNNGGFPVVPFVWKLPRGESVVIRYDFLGHIDALPLVGISTSCKILAIGKARIERITGSRQLKVDDKFSVTVDKEYEE